VAGVVQGVGFRPYVHRLATQLDLAGHVGNDTQGVFVEIEGPAPAVARFEACLVSDAPPLARIDRVDTTSVEAVGDRSFRIVESAAGGGARTFVSPDIAVCDACLTELRDPLDRRYRYPFINCTNCGPRFTITVRLPYDRPNTTMAGFALCADCTREYHDPADRRFHAQPVACPACGPRLWYRSDAGEVAERNVEGTDAALTVAQAALAGGDVVAVKGLGGYHLACDAASGDAVNRLRDRKRRGGKPFAVMVADLDAARRLAVIDDREAALLLSRARPIVLLRRREDSEVSELVAPGNPYLGVMLPYTPLHHLLLGDGPGPLVMTSGNLSDEPICFDDQEARVRLGALVDGWLVHDRPIHVPCDDSVMRIEGGEELPIRRSRGYAPLPIRLPFPVPPSLATGGELKNTFCVGAGPDAWMSQHIGDMGSVATLEAFEGSVRQFGDMYGIEPGTVAADSHPGYQTRNWAERQSARTLVSVQHHHAHIAAVMAEHGLAAGERVLGFAFDGTGFGTDGAIWGGEVLVAGYDHYERVGHLRNVALPGGDGAIRKPYRAALAHLWNAGIDWGEDLAPVAAAGPAERAVIERQLERGFQCVPTSSMGRLFDAVSSLLGVRHTVSYEAQAAIELETVAAAHLARARSYPLASDDGGEIDPAPLLRAMVADLRDGTPAGEIAAGFHVAVADVMATIATRLRRRTGLGRVALSGGVFQNVLLTRLARERLIVQGLEVLTHRVVPPNDGGLALGQLVVAAALAGGPTRPFAGDA
jgi:hydrogenase maturation protein HypF